MFVCLVVWLFLRDFLEMVEWFRAGWEANVWKYKKEIETDSQVTRLSGGNEGGGTGQPPPDGADDHHEEFVLGERVQMLHRVVIGLEADNLRVVAVLRR